MKIIKRYRVLVLFIAIMVFGLSGSVTPGFPQSSGLKFAGTISVPDASYWNYITVGVITVSKSDNTAKIMELRRETSKGLKAIRNLYYFNAAVKGEASFAVQKGRITGKDGLKRNFEVSLPLPTNNTKTYYIAAFYDANKNGAWDVKNKNSYFGDPGSEYLQLPLIPRLIHEKKNRVDCVIGSFKTKSPNSYYFGFMSGLPNALASSFGVFDKHIKDATFEFSGNSYKK